MKAREEFQNSLKAYRSQIIPKNGLKLNEEIEIDKEGDKFSL